MVEMERTADRHDGSPETNLWFAVIQEVISTEPVDDARRWLQSKDGQMVAALAGLDPGWICDRLLPGLWNQLHLRKRQHRRPGDGLAIPRQRRIPAAHAAGWSAAWA